METKPALPRVLVVDDLPLIRIAIGALLNANSLQVCGEAEDGEEAIAKTIELKPDFVILDIAMPRMNGIDAAHEIRRISPNTKIVFLTLHDTKFYESKTRTLGRLISKTSAATELIPALTDLRATTNHFGDGKPEQS